MLESTTPKGSVHSELMDIILKESDRLNSIITNFLNYARPAAGERTETDVAGAIREMFKLLRHSPDIRPEHQLFDASGDEKVVIPADTAQLKRGSFGLSSQRSGLYARPAGTF